MGNQQESNLAISANVWKRSREESGYPAKTGVVGHCDIVWYGVVWFGIAWYGRAWYRMLWYGMVCYGIVCYGIVWYSTVDMVWCGM